MLSGLPGGQHDTKRVIHRSRGRERLCDVGFENDDIRPSFQNSFVIFPALSLRIVKPVFGSKVVGSSFMFHGVYVPAWSLACLPKK